ncbi:MAG: AbrB/MazE/SpoVT family DNA-binding domain-containing protein [Candidatus Lokiarchaeota archaeon]|nr:AbrB/MazE/SpoVT family DNA-binding domain-containing protein [Candidatus Lokiarchaeota archaeon]
MEAKISSKGQVVIPIKLREKLGITPDSRLRVYEQDGKIIIEKTIDADDDPWEGMEFLDIQGDEDDLVRKALRNTGKKLSGE